MTLPAACFRLLLTFNEVDLRKMAMTQATERFYSD
jgi:hypothetical protein